MKIFPKDFIYSTVGLVLNCVSFTGIVSIVCVAKYCQRKMTPNLGRPVQNEKSAVTTKPRVFSEELNAVPIDIYFLHGFPQFDFICHLPT